MKKQEFILSSKWCVKNSEENNKVISEWFIDKLGRKPLDKDKSSYYHYPQEDNACTDSVVKEGYQEISYHEFCKYVLNKQEMKKQTLTRKQLIELRKQFSCSTWTGEIDKILKINILNLTEDFNIPDSCITLLKESGSQEQKDAVKTLGFIISQPIDYDKLKVGSKVMIKNSGKCINGIGNFNLSKPVDIVLYKSPYILRSVYGFDTGSYPSQISFHQNGKFCCFSSDEEIDYITEVISY
jgi:hypothetical protein